MPVPLLSPLAAWLWALCVRLLLAAVAAGPVPRHCAFVMDGNRRFARLRGRPVFDGHLEGFDSLKRVLELCMRLKIECVSVYAFSIDNFNRPADEVDALMDLARGRFRELAAKGELLDRYGVRVNIVGRTDLLRADVRQSVREMEDLTRHHSRAVLNVCMPYTSRDEMAQAVRATVADVQSGELSPDDITDAAVYARLLTTRGGSPPLDILVRTSGVRRLSDFLLYQVASGTRIYFVETFWPEFGLPGLVRVLLDWQRQVWLDRLWAPAGDDGGLRGREGGKGQVS